MAYRLQIRWKVFADIPPSTSLEFFYSAPCIFHRRTGKSLLREIGSNAKDTFVPLTLEPTNVFYSSLFKVLQENGISGKKFPLVFPFSLGLDGSVQVRVNLAIRLYRRVVCVSIDSDFFYAPDSINFTEVQKLESHGKLLSVVRFILALLIQGSRHPKFNGDGLRVIPCLQIISDDVGSHVSDDVLAAIVTGHPDANANVTTSLISRNQDHQVDKALLLADKQGVIFYAPPRTSASSLAGMQRRFRSAAGSLELAIAVQRMLKSANEIPVKEFQDIQRLVEDSEIVFSDSVSGKKLWELLRSEFKLPLYFERRVGAMNVSKPQKYIKVLCVAAAPVELSSIGNFLKGKLGDGKIVRVGEGRDFDPFQCYTDHDYGIYWYLASQDMQGGGAAVVDVGRLARKIQPDHIIMVGMCMGLPQSDLVPGTVVIPDAVFSLEHQRSTIHGVEYRPIGMQSNSGLQRLAKLIPTEDMDFKVVFGKKLASASIKIEDQEDGAIRYLQKYAKDVIAYDMEGWGFHIGAEDFSCLWIKAIADSGESQVASDHGRQEKQGNQKRVTTNAIRFAYRIIQAVAKSESESVK